MVRAAPPPPPLVTVALEPGALHLAADPLWDVAIMGAELEIRRAPLSPSFAVACEGTDLCLS